MGERLSGNVRFSSNSKLADQMFDSGSITIINQTGSGQFKCYAGDVFNLRINDAGVMVRKFKKIK